MNHEALKVGELRVERHAAARRRWAAVGMLAVAGMVLLGVLPPAAASSPRTCRVINLTQGKHYPPDSGQALTTAIAQAISGDELTVTGTCAGTYELEKDLTLTGISTRTFPTPTLDGGQAGTTLTVDPGVVATLANLTITGGAGSAGGGILSFGTLTLHSSTVSGNSAEFGVGGIANGGTLTLHSSTVSDNFGIGEFGSYGGIFNGGTLTLNTSIVSGNRGRFGGGIASRGILTLNSSTVSGNSTVTHGGGINISGGTATLVSSTVIGNSAASAAGPGQGGGIWISSGTVSLDSSTVSDNLATVQGGGILNSGTLALSHSTVSDNTAGPAGGDGAGIMNFATLTLNASTVRDNRAFRNGGGIYNTVGSVSLDSSTVTGNTAGLDGGGIYNETGIVSLVSSSVTGNIPNDCVNVPGC